MGRLGLVGFLTAFSGTYLIAVTGNFGFLAPVLAKQSPAVLDSINQYLPVVIINGLAAILFMIGYILFGYCHDQDRDTASLSGVLVADQIGAGESGQQADQSQPAHPAAMGRIEPGKAEQHQQPRRRVNHMRRDQSGLAGNDRCGRFTTRVQQRRDNHQHARSNQRQPAPSQEPQEWASVFRHHRAGHGYPTSRGDSRSGM